MGNMKYILIFIIGGALITPPLFSSDYLFFFPFFESDKAWACDMDTSGNIKFRQEFTVGWDSCDTEASPNGRLVIISSSSKPHLSCFFINRDGIIDQPLYNNEYMRKSRIPIVYNFRFPIAYVGTYPTCVRFNIDYPHKNISITTDTITMETSTIKFGFSPYANCIVYRTLPSAKGIGTRNLLVEGSFSTETHTLNLGLAGTNSDLCVSPDGKWAVILGLTDIGYPRMSVIGIAKDGSLTIIEQWYYNNSEITNPHSVSYTPNGKYLIMMNEDETRGLISYSVNQETGKLTVVDWLPSKLASGWSMAITPDGKYITIVRQGKTAVVRIMEDGKLVSLKTNELIIDGDSGYQEFVPPWRDGHNPPHGLLVH